MIEISKYNKTLFYVKHKIVRKHKFFYKKKHEMMNLMIILLCLFKWNDWKIIHYITI